MTHHIQTIALFGASNVGKTQILKALSAKICALTASKPKELVCIGDDIIAEYELFGKRVAIVSGGDDARSMKDGFEHIKRWHDIDVLVCATRSKGQTETFLQESVGEEAIIWLQCPWGYPEHGHFIQLKIESMATLLFDMLNCQLHHLSSNKLMP